MSRKILFIINPISGTRTKKDLQSTIEKLTTSAGIPFAIESSSAKADYSDTAKRILNEGFTDIAIAGGDGTVSQVVAGLMHLPVNFAVIPCGSGNGLALAAGISKKPEKALETLFTGEAIATDGFRINGQFACMLSGLGFDAKVAHDFAKRSSRGLSTYVKEVLRNFFKSKFYSFRLQLHETNLHTEAFFISIANSNQFGNQFTIAPHARLSDGLLDIVIVNRQNKLQLLFQTLKQVMGKNRLQPEERIDSAKPVIYFQTSDLVIENLSNAPMHIDGDPCATASRVEVQVVEKCFRLIYPLKK
jgi:YegS/Rv2252/BmrU family lipid kinase